jgi:hypothetical protein
MDQIQTAFDLLVRVVPDVHDFVEFGAASIVAGGGKEIGAIATRNLLRICGRSRDIRKEEAGRDITMEELKAVPLNVVAEFFRVASFVSDEEAQNQWAYLLCSFVEDPRRYAKVKFVSILNDLDGLDALVIKRIYALSAADPNAQFETNILTGELPTSAHFTDSTQLENSLPDLMPSPAVQISLENLERLSLIRSALFWTGPSYSAVFRTRLGIEFARSLHIGEQR